MKRIFFDTETTGLNADDEIVELAITDELGNEIYCQRFKPSKKMNPKASQLTGITDDMLIDMPSFASEFDKIKSIFTNADQSIAYNIDFDVRLLLQTCEKYDIDTNWISKINKRCAMMMYSNYAYCWYNTVAAAKRYKLTDACSKMSIKIQNAHSAVGDCIMTAHLVRAMESSNDGSQRN